MVAALIGSLAIAMPWPRWGQAPADLGMLIQRRASAERIGRRYLATLPPDTDEFRLRKMSRTLDHALQIGPHEPARAARLLREGIDEDFRRADTVVVDGWVLAVTEARFCAVIALS
jgi:hypothetical protein